MIIRPKYMEFIRPYFNTPFVKILTGIRRCGKSTLLEMIMNELLENGVKKENVIYLRLDSFINDTVIIDKEFLTTIYQKTEVFNPDRIGVIDYACLFTDGYKVLGIEFNKEGKSLFKSFLLLDEE